MYRLEFGCKLRALAGGKSRTSKPTGVMGHARIGVITSHDGREIVKNHCEKELDFSGSIV
jgi:hypothetical protein